LPAYPPSQPLAEWWGHAGGETRFQLRSFDPIGNVNPSDPSRWQFFCAQTDMNCHYDASIFSIFVGYTLHIHEFVGNNTRVDSNGDGRTDFSGYFTRWGGLNRSCTASGLDCIPFQYNNVVLNFNQNKEARYAQINPTNVRPTDYDISPPGKRWITWFYRYADGGTIPTPVPTTPPQSTPTTPAPTSVPPTDPSLIVNVNPASADPGSTISVDLALFNVQNVYGLQTTCTVDPNILQGATRSDGDVFNTTNSFFVDKGFQADGNWVVGVSRLQPNPVFAGNGVAFKLGYTVKASGQTSVTCTALGVDANGQEVALKVVNGSFNGAIVATPLPTTAPSATPQPTVVENTPVPTDNPQATAATGSSTISGKMLYQNHPDNANITVQLVDTQGNAIATVTTGADGAYQFKNVPTGTVGVTAIADLYLRIGKVVNVTANSQQIDLGSITLPGGDTDKSGDITVADASLIGANFDVPVNPAPTAADINGDGVINIRDLAIIGGNFGLKSPIIIK
jgi:hypothetical protein